MTTQTHTLKRMVMIQAHPATVFNFFTDSARWATWWGPGSTIDPRPGGRVYIRYPNAIEVEGEVLEVSPPDRIVFTYGYLSRDPVPPGASTVTIALERVSSGTRLTLTHAFDDAGACEQHVQGWRFQLSVFANLVANEIHADAGARADAWFAAWAEPNDQARLAAIDAIAASDVTFGDQYSVLEGTGEVSIHAGAAQRFMPGITLQRTGDARHCLGTALVNWVATNALGAQLSHGTNVFQFDADGRIKSVTGLWGG